MTIEQVRQLKVDKNYIFVLQDGREIKKRGSWLAFTDNVGWKLNQARIELVKQIKQVNGND